MGMDLDLRRPLLNPDLPLKAMTDPMGLVVSDYLLSKTFYAASLEPLGLVLLVEYPAAVTGTSEVAGFGVRLGRQPLISPQFWIHQGRLGARPEHVAFQVQSRELVEAFYQAALAAGGRTDEAPGFHPYRLDGYAAVVLDPDGHKIEAVYRDLG